VAAYQVALHLIARLGCEKFEGILKRVVRRAGTSASWLSLTK
jgi:hypothetical protein